MAASRVLTIYNCGTMSNQDKGTALEPSQAGELIAHLYDTTSDPDINHGGRLDLPAYAYKLIHDGPGSAPGTFGKWEADATGARQFTRHAASESKATIPGAPPGAGVLARAKQVVSGLATGAGWEANVANAVHVVKALKHKPEVINLAGWSRGGITCHMIANALYADRELGPLNIPVNIFAVDPVPGGKLGDHGIERLDVAGNVREYRAVFAIDDRKMGFRAAIATAAMSRSVGYYPMPGVHDTVVQGAPGLQAVAVLVEYLAARFLARNGTTFTRRIRLTPHEICENYAIAKKTEGQYKGLGGKGLLNFVLGLGGHAQARKDLPGGIKPDPHLLNELRTSYFINTHHEAAFKKAFPVAYDLVFTVRNIEHALTAAEGEGIYDVKSMKNRYRNSYSQLVKVLGG